MRPELNAASRARTPAAHPRLQAVAATQVPGHFMYLRDALRDVYPLYRDHARAIHTVARFMGIEVWVAAEKLARRSERRPRLRRVI